MNGIEENKSQPKLRFQYPKPEKLKQKKKKKVTIILDCNPMNKINMHESITDINKN